MKKLILFVVGAVLLLSACGTTVRRIEPGRERDLSGYWNSIDVRIVCEYLIDDALRSPRVTNEMQRLGRTPAVIVGRFRNESSEHIDTQILTDTFEAVIFNTGRLNFVSGGEVRDEIREERWDQQEHASPETMARLRNEVGADFMLTGTVRSVIDRSGNRMYRTYYVTAILTDIETNARIWIGQHNDIVKDIRRPENRL